MVPYIAMAQMKENDRVIELRLTSDGIGNWYDTVTREVVRRATDSELSRARNAFWGLPVE
jgi:hypothetical protein